MFGSLTSLEEADNKAKKIIMNKLNTSIGQAEILEEINQGKEEVFCKTLSSNDDDRNIRGSYT